MIALILPDRSKGTEKGDKNDRPARLPLHDKHPLNPQPSTVEVSAFAFKGAPDPCFDSAEEDYQPLHAPTSQHRKGPGSRCRVWEGRCDGRLGRQRAESGIGDTAVGVG